MWYNVYQERTSNNEFTCIDFRFPYNNSFSFLIPEFQEHPVCNQNPTIYEIRTFTSDSLKTNTHKIVKSTEQYNGKITKLTNEDLCGDYAD